MGHQTGPHYWRTLRAGHGDTEAAQLPRDGSLTLPEGTPLIVRLGFTDTRDIDWQSALADAITQAEQDIAALETGTYYTDPACLDPI